MRDWFGSLFESTREARSFYRGYVMAGGCAAVMAAIAYALILFFGKLSR